MGAVSSAKPFVAERRRQPAHRWLAFTIVELVVTLGIIGVLIGLLLPAVQAARESSRRMECQNNMRNLALAALNFETVWGRFQPAAQIREDQKKALPSSVKPVLARHNGISFLLPHFEQGSTFEAIDFDWDWKHSRNVSQTKQNLGGILICPSAPSGREEYHVTDYIAATRIVIQPMPSYRSLKPLLDQGLIDDKRGAPDGDRLWDGILQLDTVVQEFNAATGTWDIDREATDRRIVRAAQVRDGLSHTWMYFESAGKPYVYRREVCIELDYNANSRFRWASQETWMAINDFCDQTQITNCDNISKPYSFHEGGTNIAYADASVRFHAAEMDPQVFVSQLTMAGRETMLDEAD